MASTSVTFDTPLFSAYNPTLKDTCVSTVAKCNGVTGYTDRESTLGFSSSKTFTNNVLLITTTGSDGKHTISKGVVPSAGTFVSLLRPNLCYAATGDSDSGAQYYIRVDGTPCHIAGGPNPLTSTLCTVPIVTDQTLQAITDGRSFTDPTIPKCIASDGSKTFLGYLGPNTFSSSYSINSSTNTTDNDNCGSTGANCNGQTGYSNNVILGYSAQNKGTQTIDTSTGNGNGNGNGNGDDTESTPIWKKWWFWLIIGGAVLLIIIIIIIIVVSSRKGDDEEDEGGIDPMMLMLMSKK